MSIATVFLSYNSVDGDLVERVADALCPRGITPWLDKNMLSNSGSLIEKLGKAINKQKAFTVFLSEDSIKAKWVETELRHAIHLEEEEGRKGWIIPVYLGDPVKLLSDFPTVADRWLTANRDGADRYGIQMSDYRQKPPEIAADYTAAEIARQVYSLLNFRKSEEVNIVLEHRGSNDLRYEYPLPENIARLDNPTLVFRPNTRTSSPDETLVGEEWERLCRTMKESLTEALGGYRPGKMIRILGNSQLGLPFFLGRHFDRSSRVPLYCHHYTNGSMFTNKYQDFNSPLSGGNPHCETDFKSDDGSLLSAKMEPGKAYPSVALFIGKRVYFRDALAHVEAVGDKLPLLFVETISHFKESEEVMELVKNVVALLSRLKDQHKTTTVRLYLVLPFIAVPLLAANLTYPMNNIEFMEFRRDLLETSAPAADMYTYLPMKF